MTADNRRLLFSLLPTAAIGLHDGCALCQRCAATAADEAPTWLTWLEQVTAPTDALTSFRLDGDPA
ncbi:hypothetical protein [Candidatus Amarobacter glycogenicus]|uniref:hypothetical protein n=1 Tax=Candidatus Amarobacter glycogenicus TaxID=3140699 RepID=UPI002A11C7E6|nr:hypothetical protein [Dehalococcoidia bacterium]